VNFEFTFKSFSRASYHCSVVVVVAKRSFGALSSRRGGGRDWVAPWRCILGWCGSGLRGESDSRRFGESEVTNILISKRWKMKSDARADG
jgi:hypothetical protein